MMGVIGVVHRCYYLVSRLEPIIHAGFAGCDTCDGVTYVRAPRHMRDKAHKHKLRNLSRVYLVVSHPSHYKKIYINQLVRV